MLLTDNVRSCVGQESQNEHRAVVSSIQAITAEIVQYAHSTPRRAARIQPFFTHDFRVRNAWVAMTFRK